MKFLSILFSLILGLALNPPVLADCPDYKEVDGKKVPWGSCNDIPEPYVPPWNESDYKKLGTLGSCPFCQLTEAYLAGANLSNSDLSGTNLERAALAGANLSNANLSNANLEKAGLVMANLSNTTLNWASLIRAYLRYSNLTGANLTRANLTGAELTRAMLEGTIFCNTTMPDGTENNSDCSGVSPIWCTTNTIESSDPSIPSCADMTRLRPPSDSQDD